MIVAADAEDQVVRGQGDFDQHVALSHFMEQGDGIFFVHHGNAVADALGVAAFDRGANVEREIFGRNEAHGEFSGVQRDVNFGIDAVQVIDHRHVLVEVVDGDVPVLGHDEIQADEAGIGGGQFEAEQNLGEDDFRAQSAQRPDKDSGR